MTDTAEVNILLLGDAACGKSTFLSRISQGSESNAVWDIASLLRDENQPYVYDVEFHKRPYRFAFYDTASPENWMLLDPHVVVICYDISSRLSLINVQRLWMKDARRTFATESDIPILLLGLKRDLRSEKDPNGIIYPQEGLRIAQESRCDKYMECSARTGELMHETFKDICKTAALCTTDRGGQSVGGCTVM